MTPPGGGKYPSDPLTPAEHQRIFEEEILPRFLRGAKKPATPKLVVLGGQPGSGKSGMRAAAKADDFEEDTGAVQVDPDDLREHHPRYSQHVGEDPVGASGLVHADASQWARELYAESLKRGFNVIYDTTLGWPDAAVEIVQQAKDAGFSAEVHLIAVPLEVSSASVQFRFEELRRIRRTAEPGQPDYERNRNALPRSVPEKVQSRAYAGLEDSIRALEESGLCDRMLVRDRRGETLGEVVEGELVQGALPAAALKEKRERPLDAGEFKAHLETMEDVAQFLVERGAPAAEIESLRGRIAATVSRGEGHFKAAFGRGGSSGGGSPGAGPGKGAGAAKGASAKRPAWAKGGTSTGPVAGRWGPGGAAEPAAPAVEPAPKPVAKPAAKSAAKPVEPAARPAESDEQSAPSWRRPASKPGSKPAGASPPPAGGAPKAAPGSPAPGTAPGGEAAKPAAKPSWRKKD